MLISFIMIHFSVVCHLFISSLSSCLQSKNVQTELSLILPVWKGDGICSLIFREEHRLRLFQNRALRKIIRFKREELTGDWRKLHNEELLDLYPSPTNILVIKSKSMRWAGHMSHMWGNVKVGDRFGRLGCG